MVTHMLGIRSWASSVGYQLCVVTISELRVCLVVHLTAVDLGIQQYQHDKVLMHATLHEIRANWQNAIAARWGHTARAAREGRAAVDRPVPQHAERMQCNSSFATCLKLLPT